ncbi:MAG: D-glycero-beta-D-manno-heptose-7-phosphate kinase [Acidobacteriota bacterium]
MEKRRRDRLQRLLQHLDRVSVAVVGDFLIDEFLFGEIARVSREAPVLILRYRETRTHPGGAANTVANVAALGARVLPVGVVGGGSDGDELLSLWPANVDRGYLLRPPDQPVTRKVRILAGSFHSYRQQVVRMDYEHPLQLERAAERELLERFSGVLERVQAVIISDYSLGTVTPRLGRRLVQSARQAGVPVVVDSRDRPQAFRGATTATPNITEVEAALGKTIGQDSTLLERWGAQARSQWELDALLVTRGKLGMSLFTSDGVHHIPPFGLQEAVDVTGAGDTVAAVYAAALAAGAGFRDAAELANVAGGLVVQKKGTATVSRDELREALDGS